MLQCCVCLSSVTWCIVAKRCVLEQKLLLTAYRKSYMSNRLVPKWMTLTFLQRSFNVISTIASHSPLNISQTVRDRGIRSKGPPIGNGLWGIKWSHDRWRRVTRKGQTRDPNTHRAHYLENSRRCYLATIAILVDSLLWGSTVGYPSDSLASCQQMALLFRYNRSTITTAICQTAASNKCRLAAHPAYSYAEPEVSQSTLIAIWRWRRVNVGVNHGLTVWIQ